MVRVLSCLLAGWAAARFSRGQDSKKRHVGREIAIAFADSFGLF
jgi:hypothetical protein